MVLRTILVLFCLFSSVAAQDNWRLPCRVERVVDGDTVVAIVEHGAHIMSVQKLRLLRIDTPEMNTEEGKNAKIFLTEKLKQAKNVAITFDKDQRDSFGRQLVEMWILTEDEPKWININQLMLDNGYAKSYTKKGS